MKHTSLTALFCLLGLSACDSAAPEPGAPDVPELTGKADGAAISVTPEGDLDRVVLRGGAAMELFDGMTTSGFSLDDVDGVSVTRGEFIACASNGVDAACSLLVSNLLDPFESDTILFMWEADDGGAAAEIHRALPAPGLHRGERFSWRWDCSDISGSFACDVNDGTRDLLVAMSHRLDEAPEGFVWQAWLQTDKGSESVQRFESDPMVQGIADFGGSETRFRLTDVPTSLGSTTTGLVVSLEQIDSEPSGPTDVVAEGAFDGARVVLTFADGEQAGYADWQ